MTLRWTSCAPIPDTDAAQRAAQAIGGVAGRMKASPRVVILVPRRYNGLARSGMWPSAANGGGGSSPRLADLRGSPHRWALQSVGRHQRGRSSRRPLGHCPGDRCRRDAAGSQCAGGGRLRDPHRQGRLGAPALAWLRQRGHRAAAAPEGQRGRHARTRRLPRAEVHGRHRSAGREDNLPVVVLTASPSPVRRGRPSVASMLASGDGASRTWRRKPWPVDWSATTASRVTCCTSGILARPVWGRLPSTARSTRPKPSSTRDSVGATWSPCGVITASPIARRCDSGCDQR